MRIHPCLLVFLYRWSLEARPETLSVVRSEEKEPTPTNKQLCEIYRALALGTAEFETEAPVDIVVVSVAA